jgi:hypothetical protein
MPDLPTPTRAKSLDGLRKAGCLNDRFILRLRERLGERPLRLIYRPNT